MLIGFRPEKGQLIVARNNPDLSPYVVLFIPGVGAGVECLGELMGRAEFLHRQLIGVTRERVSIVTWMDYQAPANAREARDAAPAAEGGRQLMEFIVGQRVTSSLDDQARITVIGHGYGGLVVGYAARDYSLDVDALVFLGSASAGVGKASELHVAGAVYATSPDLFGDGTRRTSMVHARIPPHSERRSCGPHCSGTKTTRWCPTSPRSQRSSLAWGGRLAPGRADRKPPAGPDGHSGLNDKLDRPYRPRLLP